MKFPTRQQTDFKIAPEGNHVAICNLIADLGLQPGSGQYPDPKRQVYIRFELCNELHEYNDKQGHPREAPMVIGRSFTASMNKKANLRKFVEGWVGKPFQTDDEAGSFEFNKLPGKKCLLNVVHAERGDKTYANIHSATPLPKGMKDEGVQKNATVYFSLDDPKQLEFQGLPTWIQEKIENRIKTEERVALPETIIGETDDIPF